MSPYDHLGERWVTLGCVFLSWEFQAFWIFKQYSIRTLCLGESHNLP